MAWPAHQKFGLAGVPQRAFPQTNCGSLAGVMTGFEEWREPNPELRGSGLRAAMTPICSTIAIRPHVAGLFFIYYFLTYIN
jgi:hypothetical protein